MDNILSVNFGLVFWTFLNFLIFFLILAKFGTKPIANAMKTRENNIKENLDSAAKTNAEAQKILDESREKIKQTQAEVSEIVSAGRKQVETMIAKGKEEAEIEKAKRIKDSEKEIAAFKEKAISEIKSEVSGLVVLAAEKVIDEKMDSAKDMQIIADAVSNLDKINNN